MTIRFTFKIWDIKSFQLPNADKRRRLIEILLIIGSIIAVFDKSSMTRAFFMLFVLSSILYYILAQKEKENFNYIRITSLAISLSFVPIIIFNLVASLVAAYSEQELKVSPAGYLALIVVIVVLYLPFFIVLLFNALKPSK